MPTTGLFGGLLAWINVQQQGFYRTLTGALRTMRDEGTGAWMLVAVSVRLRRLPCRGTLVTARR